MRTDAPIHPLLHATDQKIHRLLLRLWAPQRHNLLNHMRPPIQEGLRHERHYLLELGHGQMLIRVVLRRHPLIVSTLEII